MKKPLHHRGVPPKGSTDPMRLGRCGALLLLALVLAPACTEAPPAAMDELELPAYRAGEAVLRIGSVEGEHDALTDVAALLPREGGGVAMLLRPENELRVFGADGSLEARYGGSGQGPGEFAAPGPAGASGDEIWVIDEQLGRVTVFGPDGALARTLALPPPPEGPDEVHWRTEALLEGDRILLRPAAPERFEADSLPLLLARAEGGGAAVAAAAAPAHDTLLRLARPERSPPMLQVGGVIIAQAGSRQVRPPVTADHALIAPAADGRSVLLAERHDAAPDGAGIVRVFRLGLGGDTIASFRGERARRPLPSEERESGPPGAEEFMEYIYQEEHLPVVTGLRAGVDGSVWVGVEGRNASTEAWWILDSELRPVAHIRLDPGLRLEQVARDRIWVVEEGEMGVPQVVVRPLVPVE